MCLPLRQSKFFGVLSAGEDDEDGGGSATGAGGVSTMDAGFSGGGTLASNFDGSGGGAALDAGLSGG